MGDPTMDFKNLQVLPLHEHPEYLNETCDLINDEWPRSKTARMMSLNASCDTLPTSLILISDNKLILGTAFFNREGCVLGHCKLTPIPSIPESCFIETVVINKAFRGKKLGTFLMKKVEEYCKNNFKLKMVHLSTKGQEKFYEKLGYVICDPVSIYGTRIPGYVAENKEKIPEYVVESSHRKTPVPVRSSTPTGAPPPPPPMPKNENLKHSVVKTNKTFMFKYL